jgi:enamine deaminase RidA (YjgF/YER057c/UK114 family)
MDDFEAMNRAYARHFPMGGPARTTVGVAETAVLPGGQNSGSDPYSVTRRGDKAIIALTGWPDRQVWSRLQYDSVVLR